jgi:1-acyl-sn-glycerol-3-phosphate acyltransferase
MTIVVFLGHMSLVWLFIRDRFKRMRWCNSSLSRYARFSLLLLNVKVNVIGRENKGGVRNALYVGNHLSYLDVLVISSQVSASFVTSTEIRDAPGLGQICIMAGCLFVERRNKMNIRNEVSELRRGLNLGLNVVIFPEATSTNGEQVLRFRRPLFFAAIDGGSSVIPFCINYRRVGGEPINLANRDRVCWYGDMDFMPHLWSLAGSGGVEVDLHFLPPIATHLQMDATELAESSHAAVNTVFRSVLTKSEGPLQGPPPGATEPGH